MIRRPDARIAGPLKSALLILALVGCAAGAPAVVPATTSPTVEPTATPRPGECPPAEPGPVAQTSVLIPGPSAGVPASTALGERLVLVVAILDSTCATVTGASVNIWHTDAAGIYGPGYGTAEIQCCSYQGTVRTDENGRFLLDTVRPGSYAAEAVPPPAHIHLEIEGSRVQGPGEILFADDPALPPGAGGVGTRTVVADLTWVEDAEGGYWSGAVTIVLESP